MFHATLTHKIQFNSSVRAYKYNNRFYFINTYSGTWAVISSRYVKAIAENISSGKYSEDFSSAYEALAKAMIIQDTRFPERRINREVKPLLVKFQNTGKCNFSCIYCFNDISIRKNTMNRETMHAAVDYSFSNPYAENGIYYTIYGGEPLMERELLYDTIEYIREKGKGNSKIKINIITNGSLLTKEDVNFLQRNEVQISVSFDGLPEFQDLNRKDIYGQKTSKTVLHGLDMLQNYKDFCILATVTKDMATHLMDMVLFLEKRNIPAVEFLPLRMLGCAEGMKEISINASEYISSLKKIIDSIDDGTISKISIRAILRMLLPLETGQTLHGELGIHRCGSGRNVISITSDGSITGCDMMPPNFTPIIGDVWKGIDNLAALDHLLLQYGKVSPICNNCPWTLFCRSGCTGASGSDGITCNSRHLLSCAINKAIYPYLLEKLSTNSGLLHDYFMRHTTRSNKIS